MSVDVAGQVEILLPDGFPARRLWPLFEVDDDGAPLVDTSADYRRAITRLDPLLFAFVYLAHHLTIERGGRRIIALSEWHLDLIQVARRWPTGRPRRDAWIAPRKAAKTTWLFLILPLWALAHGHRRFWLAFANNAEQVTGHLNNVRQELDTNADLLGDFPGMDPSKARGARDSMRMVTINGATLAARGIDQQALGVKSGADRPDLITLDDPEPGGSAYSMAARGKRLATIVNDILPMNEDAVVQWAGTVTMHGSLAHDLVLHALGRRTAAWIAETEFQVHYYPAILPPDPRRHLPERSLWPTMWSLSWLRHRRGDPARPSRAYALGYQPDLLAEAGGLYWTHDLIVHDRHFVSAHYVLTIDTAVTSKATSDETAIAITGISADGRRMCVEHCWSGRITGTQLREMIWSLKAQNPWLKIGYVEVNNGGDLWRQILSPTPEDFTIELGRPDKRGSKRDRIEWLLDQYARGAVVHRSPMTKLEEQMLAWPNVSNDDRIDTVEAGVAFHMGLPMA